MLENVCQTKENLTLNKKRKIKKIQKKECPTTEKIIQKNIENICPTKEIIIQNTLKRIEVIQENAIITK